MSPSKPMLLVIEQLKKCDELLTKKLEKIKQSKIVPIKHD